MLRGAFNLLPSSLRPFAKRLYYKNSHPAHPALKRFGTVQDLYYWVADGNLDTVLLLQNYFSAFFPSLDTSTSGAVSLFDRFGELLGVKPFSIPHCGSTKLRVSEFVSECRTGSDAYFGSLEVNIAIPEAVLDFVQDQPALYFWDRFYIGYSNKIGQMCFVHGVDKTRIFHQGVTEPVDWYDTPKSYSWAPETPVDIDEYQKFNVIMLNRTPKPITVTLNMSDSNDSSLSWDAQIAPKGVHRFELNIEDTRPLIPSELRMSLEGMPTVLGRPMVFKEFRNGAISAMHC